MQLEENKYRIRCEMGVCKNLADYTIKMERTGIKSNIHICGECVKKLHEITAKDKKAADKKGQVKAAKEAKNEG